MSNEIETLFNLIESQIEINPSLKTQMSVLKESMKNMIRQNGALANAMNKTETFDMEIMIIGELQRGVQEIKARNIDNRSQNFLFYMYVENTRVLLCENGYNYFDKKERENLLMLANQ